jgi:hypothetical protein
MSRPFWGWIVRRPWATSLRRSPGPERQRRRLFLEPLESRDLPSAGVFQPLYVLLPQGGATPFGSPGPTGTTPAQIRQAYGFNQISADGSGTTIAIVDAFDDPNVAGDLQQFDAKFSLPDPTFTKMNENGGSSLPASNGGWASEIALDVEWAHAIAPGASILLVEANSATFADLLTAVRTAAAQPNVVAVSMSWGGGEFFGENSFDSTFQTPAGHTGVTFIAASGDSGAPAIYPAISPNVLGVGGTTLNLDATGNILSESAWSGSGGGLSAVEAQPSYQQGVVTQSSTQRASPDVSYDADPNTGFPVYDSFNNGSAAPWSQFGGTSDAAPQWAGLIALADQERLAAGLTPLDGPSQTLPMLYGLSSSDFHDITSGSSQGSPPESAGPGYDLATGRGSPVANLVVADLVGQSNTGATHFSVTATDANGNVLSSTTAGSAFTVTVTALDSGGNVVSGYGGTVHFTSTDAGATLPPDATLTNGVGTFSVTLVSAGSQTVTATDTSRSAITGHTTVTVGADAASKLVFGQQPTSTSVGAAITPAVTVRVLDQYGNLVTSDNSDVVTVAIGTNPGNATLNGTTSVTVSGGVATFGNLSISAAGNGYTLTAGSGSLTGATSANFNVSANSGGSGGSGGTVIEGFETSSSWNVAGGSVSAYRYTGAAHNGTYGLLMYGNSGWLYRTDAGAQVQAGDTLSVWVEFAGSANGRAYFGFGSSSGGTLSLVAAPNTGQLILQQNSGFGFTDLAAVGQGYRANHWYRLEVDWGTSGTIVGKLFDSNGTTLLRTVTATTTAITSGGIAFRATASSAFFDTVTDTRGVNNFAVSVGTPVGPGSQTSQDDLAGPGGPLDARGVITAGDLPFLPGGSGALSDPVTGTRGVAVNVGAPAGAGASLDGPETAQSFLLAPVGPAVGKGMPSATTDFGALPATPSDQEGHAEMALPAAVGTSHQHTATDVSAPDGVDDGLSLDEAERPG